VPELSFSAESMDAYCFLSCPRCVGSAVAGLEGDEESSEMSSPDSGPFTYVSFEKLPGVRQAQSQVTNSRLALGISTDYSTLFAAQTCSIQFVRSLSAAPQ
jgi:hypothetical protein